MPQVVVLSTHQRLPASRGEIRGRSHSHVRPMHVAVGAVEAEQVHLVEACAQSRVHTRRKFNDAGNSVDTAVGETELFV